MSAAALTPAEVRTMWTNLAAYCHAQAKKRATEGRHDSARRWRLEAQQAEEKARELEHSAPADAAPVFQGAATPGAVLEQVGAA